MGETKAACAGKIAMLRPGLGPGVTLSGYGAEEWRRFREHCPESTRNTGANRRFASAPAEMPDGMHAFTHRTQDRAIRCSRD
jgi:hypothetical protein